MKKIGKIVLIVIVVCFLVYLVAISIDPTIPTKIESMFDKDSVATEELLSTKEFVTEYEMTGDYNNFSYWTTYEPYKEILNSSDSKYLIVENGEISKTESYIPVSVDNPSVNAKIYEASADEVENCMNNINNAFIEYYESEERDIVFASGIYPHDIKLLEKQFVDSIKTLTTSSKLGMNQSLPKGFLNNKKIRFGGNETKDFEEFGLMVKTSNVKLEKLALFTNGKTVAIINADVTTEQKDNEAVSLDWVPEIGETRNVTFFVDIVGTTSQGIMYTKNNVDVIKY